MTKALTIITAGSLLLILAIAIACSDDEVSVATPTSSPNATPTPSTTDTPAPSATIGFQTFLSGQNSGLVGNQPAVFKIETQTQWAELWSTHQSVVFPTTAPPAFSFDDQVLIAVFDREQSTGGFAIEVQAIARSEGGILVKVVRTVPGLGCAVTQALTQPFHIVSIDAVSGEAQLVFTDSVTDCS